VGGINSDLQSRRREKKALALSFEGGRHGRRKWKGSLPSAGLDKLDRSKGKERKGFSTHSRGHKHPKGGPGLC